MTFGETIELVYNTQIGGILNALTPASIRPGKKLSLKVTNLDSIYAFQRLLGDRKGVHKVTLEVRDRVEEALARVVEAFNPEIIAIGSQVTLNSAA